MNMHGIGWKRPIALLGHVNKIGYIRFEENEYKSAVD
jgi:hypothetical protein